MLNEQTLQKMNSMKLFGMAESFKSRIAQANHSELSHAEFTGLLIDDEWTNRRNRKLTTLLRSAHFKESAVLEDIDYKHPRGLPKHTMMELSSNVWIEKHINVLVTGPSGIGKSYIVQALGHFACRQGFSCIYSRAPRFFGELLKSRADGSYLKTLQRLAKTRVLIIDDFGLSPLTEIERRDLMEVVEDRYGIGSTLMTGQPETEKWHQLIGDPTIADGICDRLFHNAYRIALKGPSMRKEKGKKG